MHLRSDSFQDGQPAPDRIAFAIPASEGHVQLSDNRNPHLAWDPVEGAKSYVVTCIDPDVPSAPDDVNQEDREVPSSLPRVDFVHWLLADLTTTEIPEGSHADAPVARGKAADAAPSGIHGVNDYTAWFAGDPDMDGVYHGYDGPAPPWNDSILHHYAFTVYALDIPGSGLEPGFTRADLDAVLVDHTIDSASITATYTLNPRLR